MGDAYEGVKKDRWYLLTNVGLTSISALMLLAMAMELIPSQVRISGIIIPFTDLFFIVVGSLCGLRYGVAVFVAATLGCMLKRNVPMINWTTILNGLILVLLSAYLSSKGWFSTIKKTIASAFAFYLIMASAIYLISENIIDTMLANTDNYSIEGVLLGSVIEIIISVLIIYSIFNILNDKYKDNFALGHLYTEVFRKNIIKVLKVRKSTLSTKILFMSLTEAALLCVLCVIIFDVQIKRPKNQDAIYGESSTEVSAGMAPHEPKDTIQPSLQAVKDPNMMGPGFIENNKRLLLMNLKLLVVAFSVALVIGLCFYEVIQRTVIMPINFMSDFMDKFFEHDYDGIEKHLEHTKDIKRHSGDEIEKLGNNLEKLVRGMYEHIDTIEKQRKLESDLQIAEAKSQAKSVFLSNMSHEIRTPINAVLGMNEMILRDSREEDTLERAENIRSAGNTLLSLINDILDFSKIEAGKMEIIPAEYEIASALNDLIVMIGMRAANKGLDIEADISKDLPSVLYGDEVRLKQVITNILTNAVKYTEKGKVTLKVDFEKIDDDKINLFVSVKDTGIGIKESDIGKLTGAFERIEEKRNRNIEGTGLGMNITTRLLEMMSSKLEVSSVYGEGSEFSFTVEQKVLSWKGVGDFAVAAKEASKKRSVSKLNFTAPETIVLAVDDTAMNLRVLEGLLKPTKIKVDSVESGKECLEKLTEKKYDIIFLDHRMPEMDGIETRKRMEFISGNLNTTTPVIALTANAVSGAREEYIKYGFTDYLTKPINITELQKMLLNYIPEEKIKAPQNDDHAENVPETALDTSSLPAVDGLDWSFAAIHLPSMELLKIAVSDFYAVIDLHADKLTGMYERLPDKKAFEDYRIQVHGMKSSAATIGIIPLAGMAKVLEDAARDEDASQIMSMHATFIALWKDYKERLSDVFDLGKESDEEKQDFDREVFTALLDIISTSMEDYDVDRADEAIKQLKSYNCPEDMKKEIDLLEAAVTDLDSDMSKMQVSKIKGLMKEE